MFIEYSIAYHIGRLRISFSAPGGRIWARCRAVAAADHKRPETKSISVRLWRSNSDVCLLSGRIWSEIPRHKSKTSPILSLWVARVSWRGHPSSGYNHVAWRHFSSCVTLPSVCDESPLRSQAACSQSPRHAPVDGKSFAMRNLSSWSEY